MIVCKYFLFGSYFSQISTWNSIFSRARQLGREFTIEIQRAPLSSGELALKRALDVILASGLLVALAPLLAAVAILIRLETPGPLIFRQRRKGI